VLSFDDPDGLKLELVETRGRGAAAPWRGSPVPESEAIRHVGGITLAVEASEHTAALLTETMRFRRVGEEGAATRFAAGEGEAFVDVECRPDAPHGAMGVGVVHHVAWRVAGDDAQAAWRRTLVRVGRNVSPFMDRNYFRSIYFREPGGVLFEIATDGPGFTADEAEAELGTRLMLPAQYEPARSELENTLPAVRLPRPMSG
jgi:glyoxalase family protein